jgi:enamine deaminase RidA (YjgF/YER057c/UK114 family)
MRKQMDRRTRIESDQTVPSTGYRSKGMAAAGFLFTAGWVGVHRLPDGSAGELADTFEEQIKIICSYLDAVTQAGGTRKERVVEVSALVAGGQSEEYTRKCVEEYLGFEPPLFNYHAVDFVARDGFLELDWTVLLQDSPYSVEEAVEILRPFGASPGLLRSGPFVILNHVTAPGADLSEQTYNLMADADRRLRESGTALSNVVNIKVFWTGDRDTYPLFNEATRQIFKSFEPPTRSVVESAVLAKGHLLRVDFLALAGEDSEA